jgi:EAL domain-containing protein (putative c-di-GMP-specific phosphodiesterase class I)
VTEPAPSASARVLVVDDEQLIREILADFLGMEGYSVRTAPDGATAASELRRARYDVVITDLKMPNLGGLDLLAEVRRTNPEALTLVMTGFGTVETAIDALKHGAYDYVLKPFKVEQLLKIIRNGLAAKQLGEFPASGFPGSIPRSDRENQDTLRERLARVIDTLWMAYHPIFRTSDGSIFGYEALLRSDEPSLAQPVSVLWAAETLNLIDDLGRRIRDVACKAFEVWPDDCALFVNLHPSDLLDNHLFAPDSPLTLQARRVVLEITERASLDTLPDLTRRVADLRKLGFRIAIDDLGAGYAGLGAFADLEPEIVKLDMSLVRRVDEHKTRQKVVKSMITLAKEMGIQVVAEGVETEAERDTLKALGCDLLQGYLFARPERLKR